MKVLKWLTVEELKEQWFENYWERERIKADFSLGHDDEGASERDKEISFEQGTIELVLSHLGIDSTLLSHEAQNYTPKLAAPKTCYDPCFGMPLPWEKSCHD